MSNYEYFKPGILQTLSSKYENKLNLEHADSCPLKKKKALQDIYTKTSHTQNK